MNFFGESIKNGRIGPMGPRGLRGEKGAGVEFFARWLPNTLLTDLRLNETVYFKITKPSEDLDIDEHGCILSWKSLQSNIMKLAKCLDINNAIRNYVKIGDEYALDSTSINHTVYRIEDIYLAPANANHWVFISANFKVDHFADNSNEQFLAITDVFSDDPTIIHRGVSIKRNKVVIYGANSENRTFEVEFGESLVGSWISLYVCWSGIGGGEFLIKNSKTEVSGQFESQKTTMFQSCVVDLFGSYNIVERKIYNRFFGYMKSIDIYSENNAKESIFPEELRDLIIAKHFL